MSVDREYLIHADPLRALVAFALPITLGNFFQQCYNMADSIIVGRFVGENALAAVGASYSMTNVFISVAIGGGMGASVLTAQAFGARSYERLRRTASTALLAFLAVAVALGVFGLAFSGALLGWLRTPAEILPDARTYLNIYFLGLPFLFLYNVLSALFNALGRSRIPLVLLIFSSLLNVGLDLVAVAGLGMGVAGAAWATLLAQGVSAVASFLLFVRELRALPVHTPVRLFDAGELSRMLRIALPSILQQSTVSIGMMLVQSVVNSFGAQMLAGYSAASRIESVCLVPLLALGNAVSPYTAQNLGAGQPQRVRRGYRTCLCLVGGVAVALCAVTQLGARGLIGLFLGGEGTAAAYAAGVACTRFTGCFYFLLGAKAVTDGLLRGAGDMAVFTVANLVNLGLRVALSVALAPVFGLPMVWYAVPVGWLANVLISWLRYRTGRWQTTLNAS